MIKRSSCLCYFSIATQALGMIVSIEESAALRLEIRKDRNYLFCEESLIKDPWKD